MTRYRLGNGDGLDLRVFLQSIVEAAQKFPARLAVGLPCVLTVKHDGNHRVAACPEHRFGGRAQAFPQVIGGLGGAHAGVNKPYEVRDAMVAEQQVRVRIAIGVAIDGVKLSRALRAQKSLVIAVEGKAERSAKHALVGRQPLDPVARGDGQRLVGDAAFRRPHASRPRPESLLVRRQGKLYLLFGVLGMAKTKARQLQSRARLLPGIAVAEQRQNGMVKRRRRQLHLLLAGGFGVSRQDGTDDLHLLADHQFLLAPAEVAALADQLANLRLLEKKFVEPRQLRKHLQVGVILIAQAVDHEIEIAPRSLHPLVKLAVARIAVDHAFGVGMEQVLQSAAPVFEAQFRRRPGDKLKQRVAGRSRRVILKLPDQRWHKVEILVNAGKLFQQLDHAVVVFESVHTHPRHTICPGHQVLVKGLMHVPEENYAEFAQCHAMPNCNRREAEPTARMLDSAGKTCFPAT